MVKLCLCCLTLKHGCPLYRMKHVIKLPVKLIPLKFVLPNGKDGTVNGQFDILSISRSLQYMLMATRDLVVVTQSQVP